MASSPPGSPSGRYSGSRPVSTIMRPPRTNSRMSMTSKIGGGSRASDEDGKTSVKVAVRVRPPLKPTDPGFDLIPQRFRRSLVDVTSPTSLAIESPQGRKLFVFDRVFGENVNQEGLWDYLVESTNSFVQGYNVSMLAYGQSGAGKSYTMGTSGPEQQGDTENMGVIPRAAAALFEKLQGPQQGVRNSMSGLRTPTRYSTNAAALMKAAEKNWTLKASYVEIYNEQLRDLLVPEHTPLGERGTVTIREDTKGHIILTNLTQLEINSVEDLMAALNFGSMIRQTDSTAINAKSSRSHAVFTLNLVQRKNKVSGAEKRFSVPLEAMTGGESMVTIDSKLNFVDLAGSERLKNTGAQGERAKEGISINAGLASLGKVISQLSSRQAGSHVSYRDSKLTRLLQDSLGGNAITYMIACVTPAEFHMSETLNTVQYAQRARAIQSKPRIQQVSDESDKVALIDRLKAEVAFLREQIRSTERTGDRRSHSALERPERQNEREMELQNQLLDTQENYTTLSQRHAKLISEMAKARDGELADNQAFENTLGDSATERLKRSNSFAEAVEQVVLEYEKTIQSLEHSLSNTRSSLANCETVLLEKETKCAFVDTMNQQLQARLQKLMDRESSTEHYLHDLEAKLDGHTSGEEKNSAIVMELRKEIARVRENEAACEDYISTLEERLAEADQDSELMQREIDRLEHVVERQRSLGKLDNLLYELDHIQQDGKNSDAEAVMVNGNGRHSAYDHSRQQSHASKVSQHAMIPEGDEEHFVQSNGRRLSGSELEGPVDDGEPIEVDEQATKHLEPTQNGHTSQSPAQTKYVEDKLENVTQELFDLHVEHESTVNDYDLLSAKYEEALRTLAELQDAVDEARHPGPRDSILSTSSHMETGATPFLTDARVNELKDGGQYSSSRSLSSELSSAGELPGTMELSDAEAVNKKSESGEGANGVAHDETIAAEVENLRKLAAEKEQAQKVLSEKYAQLEEKHTDTLDLVEELKTEISKAKMNEAATPRSTTPVIRRKSSQNVMIIDKAHRAFASLRNIATENLDGNPDVMANFDLNLNTAMHELHARSERVQELEADIAAVKKEMETKMTIITGLTRERSSMKASPMDMSVVSTMRDQIMQSENQMRFLQETHAAREHELNTELESLRASIDKHAASASDGEKALLERNDQRDIQNKKIADLEAELSTWEGRHENASKSMEQSEKQLLATISQLEQQMSTATEQEKSKDIEGDERISSLQNELDSHKALIATHVATREQLEQSHAATREQLEQETRSREIAAAEVEHHKSLVSQLEEQIAEHENVVRTHQDGMALLHTNHAKEIETLGASHQADYERKLAEVTSQHQSRTGALEAELAEARDELSKIATQVAFALGLDVSTEKLQDRIEGLVHDQKALVEESKKSAEMESHVSELSSINESVLKDLENVKAEINALLAQTPEGKKYKNLQATLPEQIAALKKEMEALEARNAKNLSIVEELEDQLTANYDQHQAFNNRLSTLQNERDARLEEANANHIRVKSELETIKEEYANLQAKFEESQQNEPETKRSPSAAGHLRKSASVVSLPSPPPAIPLPPLPGSIGANTSPNGHASSGSVPQTPTGNRPASRDIAATQIQEDQEAKIRTIEKHLQAEKQLTTTLEEALTDLERQSNKMKSDADMYKRKASQLEMELNEARREKEKSRSMDKENRYSLVQIEEERKKRQDAERAKAQLEERMAAISKKKKKSTMNCF